MAYLKQMQLIVCQFYHHKVVVVVVVVVLKKNISDKISHTFKVKEIAKISLELVTDREAGVLQAMGSQRVGQD